MTTETMNDIVAPLRTKSDKIRALDAAGFDRATIARFLGIRYQHVRNVLGPLPSATPPTKDREEPQVLCGRSSFDESGRLSLPLPLLEKLGMPPGAVVPWRVEGGEVILMNAAAAVRHAQDRISAEVTSAESATDALRAERLAQLAREERLAAQPATPGESDA